MRAAIEADASGASREADLVQRRKPRFITHPPGFIEVVGANALLVYVLLTFKM